MADLRGEVTGESSSPLKIYLFRSQIASVPFWRTSRSASACGLQNTSLLMKIVIFLFYYCRLYENVTFLSGWSWKKHVYWKIKTSDTSHGCRHSVRIRYTAAFVPLNFHNFITFFFTCVQKYIMVRECINRFFYSYASLYIPVFGCF